MIKKYLPFFLIIVGLILLGYGGFKYLNPSKCLWIEKKADVTKIDTITKTINGEKKSRLAITYKYKVGSITYHGVFLDDWQISVKESLDKIIKDKYIIIYHNYKNPNLSLYNRPKQGIYRMAFGLIILFFGLLFYFSSNNLNLLDKTIETKNLDSEIILKDNSLSETPIN
jgi:hypothetical protein